MYLILLVVEMHTISFGIPSYNEPHNVLRLLGMIESQVLPPSVNVKEVIIVDDSDDEHYGALMRGIINYSHLPIEIIHNPARRGVAAAWNSIFSRVSSEVLVLYDADVSIRTETTWRLISPLLSSDDLGLVAACVRPISSSSLAGLMSSYIAEWLSQMRTHYPRSKYLAMGRGMAVKTDVVRSLEIPREMISVDLYVQLFTIMSGHDVGYAPDAIVEFRPPSLLREAISQTLRGFFGHRQLRVLSDRLLKNPSLGEELVYAFRVARQDIHRAAAAFLGYLLLFFLTPSLYKGACSYLWKIAETSK